MFWDTGAANTVIYLNLLRKVKGIDEYDLNKLEELLNCNYKSRIGYRSLLFGSVFEGKSIGILCCINNVNVNYLHLDNFYFLYYLLMRVKIVVFLDQILFHAVNDIVILDQMKFLLVLIMIYMSKSSEYQFLFKERKSLRIT